MLAPGPRDIVTNTPSVFRSHLLSSTRPLSPSFRRFCYRAEMDVRVHGSNGAKNRVYSGSAFDFLQGSFVRDIFSRWCCP